MVTPFQIAYFSIHPKFTNCMHRSHRQKRTDKNISTPIPRLCPIKGTDTKSFRKKKCYNPVIYEEKIDKMIHPWNPFAHTLVRIQIIHSSFVVIFIKNMGEVTLSFGGHFQGKLDPFCRTTKSKLACSLESNYKHHPPQHLHNHNQT